jgi:excisionase family DNA binding protein
MLKPEQIPLAQRQAYSVAEFCALNHVSRTYFYMLAKQGKGPRLMRVGRRFLISAEAAADWRKARESATVHTFAHLDMAEVVR